ncbi:sugar-transfer associated ATP-grasp domain-containing protein [Fodinibius salsisoli]|uniref:ATP-grasp domain-containing protein n=1 Tax=Fodinibius salsisoli TaxID=2820877 RepID=A0ABT3PM17_9BACT|nr:sugar-transfer associated ATP-grasp domain-containing protein [Fodinibius salsisoli]MCW9706763.1 hypothetical protein [Fodinibius salsisoli]
MFKKILFHKELSPKKKMKNSLLYLSRVRGAKKAWDKRYDRVLAANKKYSTPCESQVESDHEKLWSDFRRKADLTTLRVSKNISGVSNPKIIPEDIYVADIEPTLITDKSVDYISIKSFYNRWFPEGIFPKDLFHRIDGQYLDRNLEVSNYNELQRLAKQITYPVILKPNKDTYGGMDINIVNNAEELLSLANKRKNFVVQEKIKQHDFFEKFHPKSLNTIKLFLYKSVKNDQLHILSMALRMGKNGSLDNESAGGVSTFIRDDDSLNGYAVDKLGTKYLEHPNTGAPFDCKIPDLDRLRTLARKIGNKVFFARVFALDACYDNEGNWRIIELNTYGQSIRFAQYGGQPFFGEFTDEVIEHCKENHWALN